MHLIYVAKKLRVTFLLAIVLNGLLVQCPVFAMIRSTDETNPTVKARKISLPTNIDNSLGALARLKDDNNVPLRILGQCDLHDENNVRSYKLVSKMFYHLTKQVFQMCESNLEMLTNKVPFDDNKENKLIFYGQHLINLRKEISSLFPMAPPRFIKEKVGLKFYNEKILPHIEAEFPEFFKEKVPSPGASIGPSNVQNLAAAQYNELWPTLAFLRALCDPLSSTECFTQGLHGKINEITDWLLEHTEKGVYYDSTVLISRVITIGNELGKWDPLKCFENDDSLGSFKILMEELHQRYPKGEWWRPILTEKRFQLSEGLANLSLSKANVAKLEELIQFYSSLMNSLNN